VDSILSSWHAERPTPSAPGWPRGRVENSGTGTLRRRRAGHRRWSHRGPGPERRGM